MAEIYEGVAQRVVGKYPISIATSLAFEGLADTLEDGKRYASPPIFNYEMVWINLRTLIRNLQGAIERELQDKIPIKDIIYAITAEMSIINSLTSEISNGKCQTKFYVCDYRSLPKLYPKAQIKELKTERQKFQASLESTIITEIFKDNQYLENPVVHFDTSIRPDSKMRSVILTHLPFDLLSYEHFNILDLIESHTGVIKKKHQWNTKLLNGKELIRIPFDKMTVQLFGDSGGMLSPYPPDLRKGLIAVAEKYRWNTLVTKERIRLTVGLHKDAALQMAVTELYM